MGGFLQPMHLLVLAIIAVLFYLVLRSAGTAIKVITQPKAPTQLWVDPSQPMLKQCRECGEQIAKDAETCPMCKGRQLGM